MSNNNFSSYYEQDSQTSIEKAILAESINFNTIDNIQGKFFLPVMTPSLDITQAAKTQTNGRLNTANYIYLNIPGYILLQFMKPTLSEEGFLKCQSGFIPKNTVFLVEFLGGRFSIDKTCIVGILTKDL